jgi:hypothetical protein
MRKAMPSSVVSFGDAQLDTCDRRLRLALDAEVEVLARRYAPNGDPEALTAVADVLEHQASRLGCGGPHARLWAAAFRRMAALARAAVD